jgi:hypothetical protein
VLLHQHTKIQLLQLKVPTVEDLSSLKNPCTLNATIVAVIKEGKYMERNKMVSIKERKNDLHGRHDYVTCGRELSILTVK